MDNFEAQMRSMIIGNGLPNQANAHTPPETRDQTSTVSSPRAGRRLTQAQRRQGMSNRLDLSQGRPNSFSEYAQSGSQQRYPPARTAMPNGHYQTLSSDHGAIGAHRPPLPGGPVNAPIGLVFGANRLVHTTNAAHDSIVDHSARSADFRPPLPGVPAKAPIGLVFGANRLVHTTNAAHDSVVDTSARSADLRPPHRQADYMENIARVRIPKACMPQHIQEANAYVRQELQKLCRDVLRSHPDTYDIPSESIVLECFGSIASGFATADSDMDIMLLYESNPEQSDKYKNVPRIIEKALLDWGFGARLLTRTRVPIIRFCEKPPPDLLERLRHARAEWDEEMAKLLAEGKSVVDANPADDEHVDEDGDDAGDDSEESPAEPVADPQDAIEESAQAANSKTTKKTKRRKKKKTKTEEQPRPPPYKTDEERVRLYQLAIKEDWYTPEERRTILAYTDAYQQAKGGVETVALTEARKALDTLPEVLSRYREPRQRKQELEYPKDGVGVLCDINFATGEHSNPLAIHNTRLLRCYSMFDNRITDMVLFVKAWAKIRKINKPYHGTLSSYGYVLMVLHFAVNIANPPLAPNLQLCHERNAETNFHAPTTCNEFDIRFWQDPRAIEEVARWDPDRNRQSLGSLLAQFFRYYAVGSYKGIPGFHWMKDVLSLRTPGGLVTKESKGWTGATEQAKDGEDGTEGAIRITHRYLLAIEDPFEHAHNVGRPVMHHGIIAIRDEFRRANQMIVSQGYFNNAPEDLFAEGIEKERTHRYFGPNPKHHKPPKGAPPKSGTQKRNAQAQGGGAGQQGEAGMSRVQQIGKGGHVKGQSGPSQAHTPMTDKPNTASKLAPNDRVMPGNTENTSTDGPAGSKQHARKASTQTKPVPVSGQAGRLPSSVNQGGVQAVKGLPGLQDEQQKKPKKRNYNRQKKPKAQVDGPSVNPN